MRLAVFTVLRNEADIAPAFLAHLGALFDHALLMDHGSSDGTAALLASACGRHPGWRHWTVDLAGNHQQAIANFAWRWLLEHTDADIVVPLDADEFIDVPDRATLEARFAGLAASNLAGSFQWRNCVPAGPANPLTFDTPLLAADAPSPFAKVAIPRALALAMPDLVLGKGAHVLRRAASQQPEYRKCGAVLHLPLRSEAQLCRKVVDGVMGNLSRSHRPPGQSAHLFELLGQIADGTIDHARLQQLALRYAEAPDATATASPRHLDVAHLPMPHADAAAWPPYATIARTLMQWRSEQVETVELHGTTIRKAGQREEGPGLCPRPVTR